MTEKPDGVSPRPERSADDVPGGGEDLKLNRRGKERKERLRALLIAVLLIVMLAGVVIFATDRVLHKKPTTGAVAPARAG